MKPSQFLFSEQNKLKKSTKAVQKSTAELLPIPKQREEQNSMIYSLVQLPVKEGKEAPMVFPESLVSQHMKLDAKQIIGKNTEIARSLKKLRPIEVQGDQPESQRPKTEQMNGPKLQTYMKKLNDLTNGAFKKTQSHLLFASLESKLGGNQVLALVRIKECKFFNQYNMNNDKIPCLFSWEVMYRKKSLIKTTPKEWKEAQQDLLDFSFRKSLDPCEIILWKIKNNDEKYVGQFDLNTNDFIRMTEVLDYKGKIIAESTQEREMFKTLKQTRAFMGNVVFQLIQLGEYQIPVDASVKIPGSPRTDEEKLRHRIIDMAMAGHQYRWTIDENDQITIEEILTSTQETTAQWTIQEVIDAYGERCVLIEAKYGVGASRGVPVKQRRVIKQKDFDAIQSIIKDIEGEGKMAEFKAAIKNNAGAFGRVRSAAIAAAVEQIGGNTALLMKYLTECPEAVEALLGDDDYGVGEFITRVGVDSDGQQVIIMEPKFEVHSFGRGSPIRQQRVMRVKEFEAMVTLMKELDENGTLSNIKQQLKNSAGAGSRVRKAALQAAIESVGGKANELLLYMKDDMDASIMGAFLAEDDYGTFLGALDQVTLQDVDEIHLDTFADDLFKNIARHVRRNDRLRVIVEFLSALEKRPEIYVILSNYSKAPFNDVSKWSELPFLAYFDFRNYEHIMILRKMRNLFKNFKLESSPVYQAIYTAHREAKKSIYFEIPCFPKDMDFEDKKESLVLEGMRWNVLHEVARRHKWEKLHRAFEKFHTWAFEEDVMGNTAISITLRKAPFDVIETLLQNYPDQFTAAFQEFKTIRPRIATKQSEARRAFDHAGPFKQNIIHDLITNRDSNQGKLLNLLITLKGYINLNNENNMQELLEQVSTQNQTPFGHYLARLVQIGKKSDRLQRESSTISFIVDFFQQIQGGITNTEDHQKLLSKLPEGTFLLLDAQLEFNWLESLDSIRYLIGERGETGQLNKISNLVQQIEQFSYSVNQDDEESVKKLTYYFAVYVYILLEIRRKNSRAFDIVSVNVMNVLNQWVKQFADLLVNTIDGNIQRLQNYFIGRTQQKIPFKVLDLFTNFKYYAPLNSLQKGDFTKQDKLIEFLKIVQDSKDEQLAPLIMSLVDKAEMTIELAAKFGLVTSYYTQAEISKYIGSLKFEKEEDTDTSHYVPLVLHIVNTSTTYPVEYGQDTQLDELLNTIDRETIADWVHKKKITDRILKLKLRKRNNKFMNTVLEEVYKSFLAGKPVITPIEAARFLEKQDRMNCATKFIDYFKQQKLTKCLLLTLKNNSQSSRSYPDALFPLMKAQGQSWMAELDAKTFQEVLLSSSILGTENPSEWYDQGDIVGGGLDDGHILRQIALNGKYENLQIYLAFIQKAAQEKKLIHTKDERVIRYMAEVAELALAQIQGDIKSKAFSFAHGEPEDSKEKPLQVKPFLHSDHQAQKKFTNKREQGPKEQIPRFPYGLNKIRTPASTIDQLLEMSKNIEEEMSKCKLDEEITYNTYSFGKIENTVQKDIALYRYLKSWRQAYLTQNLSCAFTKMDFVDKSKSYKKTLNVLLQSQFKQNVLETDEVTSEIMIIIEAALLYGLLTYEQIANIYRYFDTQMLVLVEKILSWSNNGKFKHLIQKNLAYFIGFIQKATKSFNLNNLFPKKEEKKPKQNKENEDEGDGYEEEEKQPGDTIIDLIREIYSYTSKSRPNDSPFYKLSYEFIVQFDAIHAKDFLGKYSKDPDSNYTSMLQNLLKNKYADKVIIQIAKKYKLTAPAPPIDKMAKYLTEAKNHDVKKFLKENDLAGLISRYGDRFLNVLKELFNKNVPTKELREYLLTEWFNDELFAGLISSQSTKCYSYILFEVMLKGVFKGNKTILRLKLQEIYDKNTSKNVQNSDDKEADDKEADNVEVVQAKAAGEDEDGDKSEEKDDKQWNIQNLACLATKLNFYEFFDTVVQFNLKIHPEDDEGAFPLSGAQRFQFMTPEQTDAQIKTFNEYGFTQLGSALKLFQQFKDYTSDQDFEAYFFYKLANPQSTGRLSKSQQLWASLIQTRQLEENPSPVFFNGQDMLALKMYDFDRGVSFVANTEKESKRTQPLKPVILFDAIFGSHPSLQIVTRFLNDKLLMDTITQVMLKQEGKRRILAITTDDLEDIKNTHHSGRSIADFQRELTHLLLLNFPQFFRTLREIDDGQYNEWIVCDLETSLIYFKAQLSINSGEIKPHLDGYLKQVNNYVNSNKRKNDDEEEEDKPEEEEVEMEEYQEEVTDDEQDRFQQQEQDEEDEPKPVEPEPLPEFEDEADDPDQFVEVRAVDQAQKPVSEEKKQQKQKEIEEYQIQLQQWEQRQELKKQSKLDQAKPKQKKTKTVTRRRPKNQADGQLPKNELIEKLKSCPTLIQNNIFQTLLNLALTDDKCLHAVHEVFLDWKFINPPREQQKVDPQIIARLVKEGFKEPFDKKFFEIQEPRFKEYKAAVVADMKGIKEIIIQNEFITVTRYRDVFQLLLNNLLQLSHFFIEKPEFKNYKLLQKKVAAIPLQQDTKFIQEVRYYYQKKYQNVLIEDLTNKYFENALPHKITDKWVQIFHFIEFHQDLQSQLVKFNQLYFKEIIEWQKLYFRDEIGQQPQTNCDTTFNYRVKASNNYEPIVWQQRNWQQTDKKVEESWQQHLLEKSENHLIYLFDLTINLIKSTNQLTPYPKAFLSDKYLDDIKKIYKDLDFNRRIKQHAADAEEAFKDSIFTYDFTAFFSKINKDNWDSSDLDDLIKNKQFLIETFPAKNQIVFLRNALDNVEAEQINQTVDINNITYTLWNEKIRPEIKINLVEEPRHPILFGDMPAYADGKDEQEKQADEKQRQEYCKETNKKYPVPYSNYQPRQRAADYKWSVQNDLTMPEFYPLINLFNYNFVPDIVKRKEYLDKLDTIIQTKQTIVDLNQYVSLLNEFVESLPDVDQQTGQVLLQGSEINVPWLIFEDNNKVSQRQLGIQQHPLYQINYLIEAIQPSFTKLNFKYNTISIAETILTRTIRVIQNTTGKKCKLSTAVSLFQDWMTFQKVVSRIEDQFQEDLYSSSEDQSLKVEPQSTFKFFYVEVNEIHINSCYPFKPARSEGLDNVFRFGPTQFFVHSNAVIIRLNVACVTEKSDAILQARNLKLKDREFSKQSFVDVNGVAQYMSKIVNKEDMLKQLFQKK